MTYEEYQAIQREEAADLEELWQQAEAEQHCLHRQIMSQPPTPSSRTYCVALARMADRNDPASFETQTITVDVKAGFMGFGERELLESHCDFFYPEWSIVDLWEKRPQPGIF